jgi:hypothetical protein
MRFFTPDLYRQFNSKDEREADRADRKWEVAVRDYRKHLKQISKKQTPSVRDFAKSLNLHDARYVGLTLPQIPDRDVSLAVLMLRHHEREIFLVYLLGEEPLMQEVKPPWPFSTASVHWLYDEFDITDDGMQQHEILLSNGRTITLRFREAQLITHDLSKQLVVA